MYTLSLELENRGRETWDSGDVSVKRRECLGQSDLQVCEDAEMK